MTVLVTGGAGFIGAHVVRCLVEQGEEVVVVDDLSTGEKSRIPGAQLVELDISSAGAGRTLRDLLVETRTTGVVHLAAKKQVGESVERPEWYYQQNVGGLATLLDAMREAGTHRFVFSSSAAAYGQPESGLVSEDAPTAPINPYGQTKLIGEWQMRAAARAWGLRGVALRYFNVAGAGTPQLGDPAILNLVTMVLDRVEKGERPLLFGDDYPTADGTCVRDYVHVQDLAEAHVAALGYLERDERAFDTFNIGTGTGASVREVLAALAAASGCDTTPDVTPRRAGDPAELVASVDRASAELGWRARFTLPEIVDSAWQAWRVQHDSH